jgi:hypothetical protein
MEKAKVLSKENLQHILHAKERNAVYHANIYLFADNRSTLLGLLEQVKTLLREGESATTSELFYNGSLHVILGGEPVDESLEEGDLIIQRLPASPSPSAKIVVPAKTLGQVVSLTPSHMTVLYSNGVVLTYPRTNSSKHITPRVTYPAFVDACQEEYFRLGELVAAHFVAKAKSEREAEERAQGEKGDTGGSSQHELRARDGNGLDIKRTDTVSLPDAVNAP